MRLPVRHLTLEFRDGSLNGWHYLALEFRDGSPSGWHYTDSPDPSLATARFSLDPIRGPQVGKAEVLGHLGKPNGKSLCPSEASDFKYRCRSLEVWRWDFCPDVAVKNGAPRELYVHFDDAGAVRQIEPANPQAEAHTLHERLVELARQHLVPEGFVEQATSKSLGWTTSFVRAPYTVSVGFDLRVSDVIVLALEDDRQPYRTLYTRRVAQAHLTTAFDESVRAELRAKLQEYVAWLADDAQRRAGSSRSVPLPLTRSDVGLPAPSTPASSR